ncbi:MAG: insulinase family protein [Gammaproteobacteria bacterium]|jgi:zinc protease|nr:insulinase family protein [Gammaproteobacteria bacterium]MDH3952939.1 insulinase family protein [Gammaproteobacteria bacterium]NCF59340.1 insulinase family protein [Gammaproteobacteria bacterium]
MSLFSELRRRNVFKVLLVYLISGWLIVKLLHHLHPVIGLPHWIEKLVGLMLLVGLPLALYFAYIYEFTPVGLKKAVDVDQTQSIVYKTGQKLNAALAVMMFLLLAAMVVGRLFPEPPALIDNSPVMQAPTMQGVPPEIRSVTLENGLEIIVWPDHDIPNVALYYFVRAGGRNGYPGITGLSHFFEHMMFNGTEDLEPGEFDRIMEAAGGHNNAYTSNDITVYQDWFPRSALETVFEIESERLQNLEFDAEAIESERGVIASERRTTVDNNNISKLVEQVRATAYVAHPYQFPIIGWPSDIESWTQEDLESFYRTYYAPNNITMVVVGDVTPDEIFELAEEYLEDIPAQDPPADVRTVEPVQQGERRVVIETGAQTPMLHVAFHAGAAADPETLAMRLLLSILVDGDSSRLHRLFVEEEQLAIAIGGFLFEGFDPGLVYFYATLPPGGDLGLLEQRLFEELTRIAEEGVGEVELGKASNIALADFWRTMATINGKAASLGEAAVFRGSYEKLFDLAQDIEAVSGEDLKAVAASVFRRSNATIGALYVPAAEEEE